MNAPREHERTLADAVSLLRASVGGDIEAGIILGTGLGEIAADITIEASLDYREIPGMPLSTVESHVGRLILGRIEGRRVAALQGRFHLYEGYSARQIAFPVRLLRRLGAETLVVTFACGSLNPSWSPGDLVLLDDHINLQGTSPLLGSNDERLGPRFPDMSEPYDRELQRKALETAEQRRITLRRGVYAGVLGPQLETRAEHRMLRALGADVVGMSTVPEVIAARHVGLRVLAIGVVTNLCLPETRRPVDVEEVLRIAGGAEDALSAILRAVLVGD